VHIGKRQVSHSCPAEGLQHKGSDEDKAKAENERAVHNETDYHAQEEVYPQRRPDKGKDGDLQEQNAE
jgi:hypothetical protein